ncbi:unnamed protein product [Caenorhabditis brenneri]
MPTPNANHWITDQEYIDLLNFLIEKTENVEAPMSVQRMAIEFKEKSGAPQTVVVLNSRICKLRSYICSFKHIDTKKKVKLMFALSASVKAEFLEELRKNAFVEVDEKNRIAYYKAIDGSLELRGDHSQSAKYRTAQGSYRSLIIDYFENKNKANAVPKNDKEKEMWNLIEFITEKCRNVNSPLSIWQWVKDFNEYFGLSKSLTYFHGRIESYCFEIQKTEFLDTHTKVKQLFGLSATLDSECLKEFRKNADVEVDHLNRITKYTAKDGSLTLYGDHSSSAKRKLARIEWENKRNAVKKYCNFEDDDDDNETPIRYHSSPSNWTKSLDDYDTNYSIDDQVKLKPFCREIQEDLNEIEEDEDFQQIPKPHQTLYEHNELIEVPIKLEHEEPVEVKPETFHNPKIKFFELMQSLIVCLDIPSLSWIQSKINQKMREIEGSYEVILNNEILLTIDSLITRMTDHSVENLSENVESVNLSNFLIYLKAAVLNSKMSGMDGLVKNISELIEKSLNKRIPMEIVENSLCAMLDIDGS